MFPKKCNVTLAKIIDENHIKVKVWERGAGLTKACGTAACATAYAAKINGKVNNKTQNSQTSKEKTLDKNVGPDRKSDPEPQAMS